MGSCVLSESGPAEFYALNVEKKRQKVKKPLTIPVVCSMALFDEVISAEKCAKVRRRK
jgi:hypothetical protein